jgi:hypothetical protein
MLYSTHASVAFGLYSYLQFLHWEAGGWSRFIFHRHFKIDMPFIYLMKIFFLFHFLFILGYFLMLASWWAIAIIFKEIFFWYFHLLHFILPLFHSYIPAITIQIWLNISLLRAWYYWRARLFAIILSLSFNFILIISYYFGLDTAWFSHETLFSRLSHVYYNISLSRLLLLLLSSFEMFRFTHSILADLSLNIIRIISDTQFVSLISMGNISKEQQQFTK